MWFPSLVKSWVEVVGVEQGELEGRRLLGPNTADVVADNNAQHQDSQHEEVGRTHFQTTKLVSFFFLTRKKIKSNAKTATTSTTSTTLTTTTTLTTLTTTTTAKTSLARSFAHRLISRIKLSMRGFNDFVQREDEDWETRAVTTLNTNWRRKGSARGAGGGREGVGGGNSTQADLSAD